MVELCIPKNPVFLIVFGHGRKMTSQVVFWGGVEIFDSGSFWVGRFGKYFLGGLIYARIFWVIKTI